MLKKTLEHRIIQSTVCGEIREVLSSKEYKKLEIAIAVNIQPNEGHYHSTFEEIYFLLDGELILEIYEPEKDLISTYEMKPNEVFIIKNGLHHKIAQSSPKNRLCVISIPKYNELDVHRSEVLESHFTESTN